MKTNDAHSDRSTHLDGLRGLAALVVVVVHGIIAFDFAFYTGQAKDSLVSWDVLISGAPLLIPMAGDLSVCLFFALSGYVLSHSFSKTRLSAIALLFKRYVRFTLPILSACLISYALLASGLMDNHSLAVVSKSTWLADQMQQTPSFIQALGDGLYGALIMGSSAYDSSLWTMPIELWGSIVLIAVFSLTAFRSRSEKTRENDRVIIFLILGLLGACSYLGLFAFGALLYLTQIHRRISSRGAAILLGLGLFLGTIPYSAAPWRIVRPFVEQTLPTLPGIPYAHSSISFYHSIGALLILIAANAYLPFRRMLASRRFLFLGDISFPLYLIHIPLLLSIVCSGALAALGLGLPYAQTMILSLVFFVAVSILAAGGLMFIIERPSIALSKKIGLAIDNIQKAIIGKTNDG